MGFYIGIEDVAANALIESLSKSDKRFLTYKEIEDYGTQVVEILRDQNEKAVLTWSRESTSAMFHNYSDFFEEKEMNGMEGIELKHEKSKEDLICEFRGYLPLKLLMAFLNQKAINILGA